MPKPTTLERIREAIRLDGPATTDAQQETIRSLAGVLATVLMAQDRIDCSRENIEGLANAMLDLAEEWTREWRWRN